MSKKIWWTLALTVALAGCSSVSLNEGQVPVEDRSAAPAASQVDPRAGAAVDPRAGAESRVAAVSADSKAGAAAGPAGVGRLVYFDYDSVEIKPEFRSLIEGHARFLRANPSRRVAIEGHTDERGGREYNLALGQRRSEAVRRSLGLLGVADNQIEAVSLGKEKPAETGSDEGAWAKNRRAEINYR